MVIGIDSSILLGYYQVKAGISSASSSSSSSTSSTSAVKYAPTPPWNATETDKQASANVTSALAGHKLIDESAAKLDLPGASADYKKLFALYQGLGALSDLATHIKAAGLTSADKTEIQKTFANGLSEISSYVGSSTFDKLRLVTGTTATSDKATLTVAKPATVYTTPPLTNSPTGSIAALEGDVRFNIQVTRVGQTYDVPIDLSQMPDQTRSIANVINYVNSQLAASGVETRFGATRIPGQPQTVTAGSQTVTLSTSPDQWALKVTVGTSETVSFSSPQSAGAVYMAQQVGDPNPDKDPTTNDSTTVQQLLKFQTDTTNLAQAPQVAGQANYVDGRVFAENLDASVTKVHAQVVGSDGSVYMLADVNGKVDGQSVRGSQDVALLKYDSAGQLIYTRTLGAASTATGLSLAVSADGKVAVAGAVTGALDGTTDGALNSGTTGANAANSDSFVTLYDADGQEVWTQRRGARLDDQADQVAFGADGTIYVAGQTKSALPAGGAVSGDWDSYIEAFATDAKGKVTTAFTQTFGTAGADKPKGMVVDGQALVVANVENGHAVLHRFDISSGSPVEVASRDLGDLMGGDIAGLALDSNGQLVIAGTTSNTQLSAGQVTSGPSGGADAFAARIDASLSASSSDRLAYYGGSGDDKATALSVANGQVWIAGQAGADLPEQPAVGTQDGFLANIDVNTGAVDWSRRFTGLAGRATPTAIAAAPSGASVLDRLGLPTGQVDVDSSQQLSAVSSLRAGDQFTVAGANMPAQTVTIAQGETLATLATKIQRASGFTAKVTVVSTLDGQHQLKIEPASASAMITIGPGQGAKNALPQLGIPEGVVQQTVTDKSGGVKPADGKANLYGLTLPSDLNLSNDAQVSHALAEIAAAQGVIRSAYKDLLAAATPKSLQAASSSSTSGTVPAYLTAQISNYQAALDRLTGGSSSSSSSSSSTATLFGLG
jgi:hypothetical protein